MKYSLVLSEEARKDTLEASAWYDQVRVGLGSEFLSELEFSLLSVQENPFAKAQKSKRYRIALLRRFPFKLVYQIFSDNIIVIGVIHHSRNPRLIQQRAK